MKFQGSQNYVATQDLMLAVNAAIKLQRPLLVKGEPGTGKTMLAEEVAQALGMIGRRHFQAEGGEVAAGMTHAVAAQQHRLLIGKRQPQGKTVGWRQQVGGFQQHPGRGQLMHLQAAGLAILMKQCQRGIQRQTPGTLHRAVLKDARRPQLQMQGMEFIETPTFTRLVTQLLTDDEYREMQNVLMEDPERGDIIKGGGGIRKLRHAVQGRGKSGGVRAIYYWVKDGHQIYMLVVYPKAKKDDLTDQEVAILRELVKEL